MSFPISLTPIGRVRGGRTEPIDDQWDSVQSTIRLEPDQFKADALSGLEAFSHIEVVFHFDRVPDDEIRSGARHPRGREDWPAVGIFANAARAGRTGSASASAVSKGSTGSRFTSAASTPSTEHRFSTSNPS